MNINENKMSAHTESQLQRGHATLKEHITGLRDGSYIFECAKAAVDFLSAKISVKPDIGIICGSGLGGLANLLTDSQSFLYSDIPNFPVGNVSGHAGRLVFGNLSGKRVVCMQGRVHLYEGVELWKVTLPVRVMAGLGVGILVVTNAAGGLNVNYNVGDFMIIKDHVDMPGLTGHNTLMGKHDERLGERFVSMTDAYDGPLRRIAQKAAAELGLTFVHEGVYCMNSGPTYETIAVNRIQRSLGIDAVGMSTAPEVVVARQCNLRVLGLSLITDMCVFEYETSGGPTHEEVLQTTVRRATDMQNLVTKILVDIA